MGKKTKAPKAAALLKEQQKETEEQKAVRILTEARAKKIAACEKEVQEVLRRHGMRLETTPVQVFITTQK